MVEGRVRDLRIRWKPDVPSARSAATSRSRGRTGPGGYRHGVAVNLFSVGSLPRGGDQHAPRRALPGERAARSVHRGRAPRASARIQPMAGGHARHGPPDHALCRGRPLGPVIRAERRAPPRDGRPRRARHQAPSRRPTVRAERPAHAPRLRGMQGDGPGRAVPYRRGQGRCDVRGAGRLRPAAPRLPGAEGGARPPGWRPVASDGCRGGRVPGRSVRHLRDHRMDRRAERAFAGGAGDARRGGGPGARDAGDGLPLVRPGAYRAARAGPARAGAVRQGAHPGRERHPDLGLPV